MILKNWKAQLLGSLLLALLLLISIPSFTKRIPPAIENSVKHELQRSGMNWVVVKAQGRNITLSGQAPTVQQHQQALSTANNIDGVRDITDNMTPRIISPYTFAMRWSEGKLVINGFVSDQKSYTHVLETSFKLYGKDNVTGDIKLGAGAPKDWDALLQTSLASLRNMDQGIVDITQQSIQVSGTTTATATKQQILNKLMPFTDQGYDYATHIVAADAANLACQQRFTNILTSKNIQFESGQAGILPSSIPLLKELSHTAALCPKANITIAGHTDNQGRNEYNTALSKKRAQAVISWLFQHGIDLQRLNPVGYGAKKPIADNSTEQGRSRNRRIEFIVGGK